MSAANNIKHIMILWVCLLLTFPIFSYAADEYSAFSVNAYLKQNGELSINEEFIFDYGDVKKHGLFRTIPLVYNESQNWFELQSVSVKNKNNEPYLFETTSAGNVAKIKIGDPNISLTGTHYYNLSYSLLNVGGNNSVDWKVISKIREPIAKLMAHIYLPKPILVDGVSATCTFLPSENTKKCELIPLVKSGYIAGYKLYLENVTNEEVLISVVYQSGLVFSGVEDKSKILVISKKIIINIIILIFMTIIGFIIFFFRKRIIIIYKKLRKEVVPPDSYSYLARAMAYNKRIEIDDVIATLIDLSERGYVYLEQQPVPAGANELIDYSIEVLSNDLPEGSEKYLLESTGSTLASLYSWLMNDFRNHKQYLEKLALSEINEVNILKTSDELPKLIGFRIKIK